MLVHGTTFRNIDVQNFSLSMGGNKIERTQSYKYLGVTVDHKLNWKMHIEELCSALASVCGVLSKVRHYLDRKSLMLIYNSLFESRLRYAILGWGTVCEYYLSKLKILQNRAVRFITFSSFRAPVAPLYSKLKILPLSELLFHQRAIFMHSLYYRSLPFALSVYCQQPQHRYPTRYAVSKNYTLPPVSTDRGKKSIKFSGPKVWTEIPMKLKDIAFRKPFSKKLKEHILSSTYVEMPPEINTVPDGDGSAHIELEELFNTDDENFEFEGFVCLELEELFLSDDEESDFEGFEISNINDIFLTDSEDEEFLGF